MVKYELSFLKKYKGERGMSYEKMGKKFIVDFGSTPVRGYLLLYIITCH